METALATSTEQRPARQLSPIVAEFNMQQRMANILMESGFFADSRQMAQAFVKIQAGKEMGFQPLASMTGVNIIKGRVAIGANLIAAAMKKAGYHWLLPQHDNKGCVMELFYRGLKQGTVTFLEADAKLAGLLGKDNWVNYPRSMYFARCVSLAGRTYAQEIFGGISAYTAEELGQGNTDENGAPVIEATVVSSKQAQDEVLQAKLAEITQEKATAAGMPHVAMRKGIPVFEDFPPFEQVVDKQKVYVGEKLYRYIAAHSAFEPVE